MRSSVVAQSVWRLPAVWIVRGSNPGRNEILRTLLDWPWVPRSLLYMRYTGSFPGIRARHGVNHPPPSSAKVKEKVEQYLYCCSGNS